LVNYIQEKNLENRLSELVEEKWKAVEDGIKLQRLKKF
jgi:hypothetical protein